MKNVKLNLERIKEKVINSNDFSELSVINVIKSLYESLTIVDSIDEAEETFKNWFEDYDGGAEKYIKSFGGVHTNVIEKFRLSVVDPNDEIEYDFQVSTHEYYVDSGSVDYLYGVSVSQM